MFKIIIIIIIMIIIIIIIIKFNGVDRILTIIRLTQKLLKMTMNTVNVNEKDCVSIIVLKKKIPYNYSFSVYI